jgi:hypothetical protein
MAKLHQTTIAAGETNYAWSYEPLPMTPKLISATGQITSMTTFRLGWPPCDWDMPYHVGFTIPKNLSPGRYGVQLGGGVTLMLDVTAPIVRQPPIRIRPDASQDEIEAALNRGDIELSPCRYKLTRALWLWQANRRIYLNGGTLTRTQPGDYLHRMFTIAADGCGIIGPGTIENYDHLSLVMHGNHSGRNLLLQEVTFKNGCLGWWDNSEGLRVDRCSFDRCGLRLVKNGLWTDCTFKGIGRDPTITASGMFPAFELVGGGRICVLGCEFDSTPQGVRLNAAAEPIEEVMISGVTYRCIGQSNNQCELFASEGPGQIRKVIYFHHRESGCVGPAVQHWNAPIDGMLIRDGRSMSTVYLSGRGVNQKNIRVEDWEAAGYEAVMGAATGNTFLNCLGRPWPSRENQLGDRRPFEPNRPAFRVGSNVMTDCQVASAAVAQ